MPPLPPPKRPVAPLIHVKLDVPKLTTPPRWVHLPACNLVSPQVPARAGVLQRAPWVVAFQKSPRVLDLQKPQMVGTPNPQATFHVSRVQLSHHSCALGHPPRVSLMVLIPSRNPTDPLDRSPYPPPTPQRTEAAHEFQAPSLSASGMGYPLRRESVAQIQIVEATECAHWPHKSHRFPHRGV